MSCVSYKPCALGLHGASAELPTVVFSAAFEEDDTMNSETMDSGSMGVTGQGTSSTSGLNGTGTQQQVQRVAEKAHAAVDTVAQSVSTGADRMMSWQQEYGDMAREQIRANPLAVVFGAFALGYVFAKLTR
jgi:hypothetical protein